MCQNVRKESWGHVRTCRNLWMCIHLHFGIPGGISVIPDWLVRNQPRSRLSKRSQRSDETPIWVAAQVARLVFRWRHCKDPTAEYLSVSSWDELNLPKDGRFKRGGEGLRVTDRVDVQLAGDPRRYFWDGLRQTFEDSGPDFCHNRHNPHGELYKGKFGATLSTPCQLVGVDPAYCFERWKHHWTGLRYSYAVQQNKRHRHCTWAHDTFWKRGAAGS